MPISSRSGSGAAGRTDSTRSGGGVVRRRAEAAPDGGGPGKLDAVRHEQALFRTSPETHTYERHNLAEWIERRDSGRSADKALSPDGGQRWPPGSRRTSRAIPGCDVPGATRSLTSSWGSVHPRSSPSAPRYTRSGVRSGRRLPRVCVARGPGGSPVVGNVLRSDRPERDLSATFVALPKPAFHRAREQTPLPDRHEL